MSEKNYFTRLKYLRLSPESRRKIDGHCVFRLKTLTMDKPFECSLSRKFMTISEAGMILIYPSCSSDFIALTEDTTMQNLYHLNISLNSYAQRLVVSESQHFIIPIVYEV